MPMPRARIILLATALFLSACDNHPADTGSVHTTAADHTINVAATTTTSPSSTTTTTAPPGSQTLGHVRVSIKKISVGKVPLKQADGSVLYSDEPRLMIALRIENVSDQKRSEYTTWVPDLDAAKTVARLTDDRANELKRVTFGFGNNVQGRTVLDTLTPGKVIGDLLVFEDPSPEAKEFVLELPGANCGVTGTFRFTIPAKDVARSKDRAN
jgi:hypothetical protein